MLERKSVVDQVEVTRDGHVQVRFVDLIIDGEEEIIKDYHRHVLSPGDPLEEQDPRVIVIAKAVWTPAVIAEYRKEQERKKAKNVS